MADLYPAESRIAEDTLPDGEVIRTVRLPGLTPMGYEYETMFFPLGIPIDEETVQEICGGVCESDEAARARHRDFVRKGRDWPVKA